MSWFEKYTAYQPMKTTTTTTSWERKAGAMTLDEAITHAREIAQRGGECAKDHEQLAEWLEELRGIVRCRDCVHYREHKFFQSTLGMGLGTDISDVCMFFANGVKVEPDGFCAWGERREQ